MRSFIRSQKWAMALALAAGLSLSGVAAAHGGNPSEDGGASANPRGVGVNGGNGIHDIAGGAPGQNGGVRDGDGKNPACTMHGRFRSGGTHAKDFCN
jgi:hypothetical protein